MRIPLREGTSHEMPSSVHRSMPGCCRNVSISVMRWLGGVGTQVGVGLTGERAAVSRPTLVEHHEPVGFQVEEPPCTTRTGLPSGRPLTSW